MYMICIEKRVLAGHDSEDFSVEARMDDKFENVLTIKNLTVAFAKESMNGTAGKKECADDAETLCRSAAVKDVSLELRRGEILALVGESGCGKTVLCKSILGILCDKARIMSGKIVFGADNLLALSEKEMREYRGGKISMVFQDPMTSLNPTICVGEQIAEAARLHRRLNRAEAKAEAIKLMQQTGIPQAWERYHQMPHNFSGGMRQRIAIAIALAWEPDILLADEPTTALDIDVQAQILKLLKKLQKERQNTIVFITHDLGLAESLADRTAVMRDGRIVELGNTEEIFKNPQHEYTKRLLSYANYGKSGTHRHGHIKGDTYAGADCFSHAVSGALPDEAQKPAEILYKREQKKLIEIKNLSKYFKLGRNKTIAAFEHLNMDIYEGELLGVVGRSGCGKSTLARCLMEIYEPSGGEIIYANGNMRDDKSKTLGKAEQKNWKQMIFQDSASAFNPGMTIEEIIGEPLRIMTKRKPPRELILSFMEQAELGSEFLLRRPYELSGGQRQRAAIARALSVKPKFIIADEPISSLDVSVQSQIVHLFKKLQTEQNLTIMLIAHDLPMVQHVSDRIIEFGSQQVN